MPRKRKTDNYLLEEARLVWSIFLFVGAALVCGVLYGIYLFACRSEDCFVYEWQKVMRTSSFEECAARGFPVSETEPRECRAGNKVFTEG